MSSPLTNPAPGPYDDIQLSLVKLAYWLQQAAVASGASASPTTMLLPSMAPNYSDGIQPLLVKCAYWAEQITGGGGSTGNLAPDVVDPEGVKTASPGTTYFNTAAGTFWVKATGVGNTGWAIH